jgi:glycyl-tRNA synthetase
VKKDGMPETATRVFHDLKKHFKCFYDDGGAVGRRYRRMDEIGTPYCVTIDGETAEDEAVTVRDRDTMEQERIKISELTAFIQKKIDS